MKSVVRYLADELASTLPRSEEQARGFVQGLAWGLVLYLAVILLVSAATLWAQGRGW